MDDQQLQDQLSKRFKELPEKVRAAITSADVEGHLRQLAEKHKLHLDQWALLENEVMLTMLGFQKTADLAKNISREVGIQEDAAETLAADISQMVFEPIRDELERMAPAAQTVPTPTEVESTVSAPDQAEQSEQAVPTPPATPIEEGAAATPAPAAVPPVALTPATPPKTAPRVSVERAPISQSYGASTPSHERVAIEGDPYREQVAA